MGALGAALAAAALLGERGPGAGGTRGDPAGPGTAGGTPGSTGGSPSRTRGYGGGIRRDMGVAGRTRGTHPEGLGSTEGVTERDTGVPGGTPGGTQRYQGTPGWTRDYRGGHRAGPWGALKGNPGRPQSHPRPLFGALRERKMWEKATWSCPQIETPMSAGGGDTTLVPTGKKHPITFSLHISHDKNLTRVTRLNPLYQLAFSLLISKLILIKFSGRGGGALSLRRGNVPLGKGNGPKTTIAIAAAFPPHGCGSCSALLLEGILFVFP